MRKKLGLYGTRKNKVDAALYRLAGAYHKMKLEMLTDNTQISYESYADQSRWLFVRLNKDPKIKYAETQKHLYALSYQLKQEKNYNKKSFLFLTTEIRLLFYAVIIKLEKKLLKFSIRNGLKLILFVIRKIKMSNQKYDEQAVIEVVFDYLSEKDETEISAMPVEKLYEDIKVYAGHQQMPHFSQFRRYMISELSLEKGERLTSAKVYEIKNNYMILSKIEEILCEKYKVSIYAGNPIICTIPLPPKEIFDEVTIGYAKENRKSHEWGKINMIRSSCAKIKKRTLCLFLQSFLNSIQWYL